MKVVYTSHANGDLEAIAAFLSERSPDASVRIARVLERTIAMIGLFPSVGRVAGIGNARVVQTGRSPYLIYWSADPDEVRILHVRHAACRALQSDQLE